jgi:oligopeptide/dipeptide ABC transporter ATP-binding protein
MLMQISKLCRYFDLGKGRVLHAVDDVSLELDQGTVTALVGESGSGKSTLGKAAIGLLDKTSGEVRFNGRTLPARYRANDFRRQLKDIQMIFQDSDGSLNPRLTVREIIREPLTLAANLTSSEQSARVDQLVARVGLSPEYLGRYPHELSGGQRQRVGIARALVVEPQFVVCDEPLSALDVSVQAQVANLLMELQESLALTLLFIAHDLSIVRHVADRVAVMYFGVLVEEGPTQDVYHSPAHPYTQALIASSLAADPKGERQRAHTLIRGEPPTTIEASGCRFVARCPYAVQRCHKETPLLRKLGTGRQIACHLIQ